MPQGGESTQIPQSGSSQGLQPGPGLAGCQCPCKEAAPGHQCQPWLDGKELLGWCVPMVGTNRCGGWAGEESQPLCLLNG